MLLLQHQAGGAGQSSAEVDCGQLVMELVLVLVLLSLSCSILLGRTSGDHAKGVQVSAGSRHRGAS